MFSSIERWEEVVCFRVAGLDSRVFVLADRGISVDLRARLRDLPNDIIELRRDRLSGCTGSSELEPAT